jgi:diamine N-acetyltransferase
MKLIDITKNNWMEVIFLTTNQEAMPTLCEEFVASNALSIVQAQFEGTWTTKAIECEEKLIGFTMYGYCKEHDYYELCRIMIGKRYQGKGYGTQAIKMVLSEMRQTINRNEVYLSTSPKNVKGKDIYEKIGFVNTGKIVDGEELYCFTF